MEDRENADPGHVEVGKLRQRLASERGAAGAEYHDVGCSLLQPGRGLANRGEIVLLLRQAQQRQRAFGIMPAQAVQRAFCASERRTKRGIGYTVRADVFVQRTVDRLIEGHDNRQVVIVRASGRSSTPDSHLALQL